MPGWREMAERFNWRAKTSVDLLAFLSLRKRKQVAMGLRGMGDRSETERGPEPSGTISRRGSQWRSGYACQVRVVVGDSALCCCRCLLWLPLCPWISLSFHELHTIPFVLFCRSVWFSTLHLTSGIQYSEVLVVRHAWVPWRQCLLLLRTTERCTVMAFAGNN